MNKYKLDPEEQELLDSVERGEWISAEPTRVELRRYIRMARNTLRKDKRINIRISQSDLEGLQTKAIREGIPYQTLVSSILHKYISGRLVTQS
jgi:predicted DNA binding CopG/RHH family protein